MCDTTQYVQEVYGGSFEVISLFMDGEIRLQVVFACTPERPKKIA